MENCKLLAGKKNNRVLIVDDNPGIHEDFRKILRFQDTTIADFNRKEALVFDEPPPTAGLTEPAGEAFEVDSAYQGQQGLEMVRRALDEGRPYAMAFVDVRMPPGWDGVETIAQMWRNYPQLQVVICSAYSDYSWGEITRKLGASDALLILKKPFDNIEVLQLAHALTKKWIVTEQAGIQLSDLDRMVRQRTDELATANERFSKAFHASPLPMAICKLSNAGLLDVNESFLKLFELQRDATIGRTDNELGIWADPAGRDRFWSLARESTRITELKCQVRVSSGAVRQVLGFSEELRLAQERCALVLFYDLTEHLKLEEQIRQSQKMQAVGQLAAGVAHDFNNLITVIQGHAEMRLRTADLDREVGESLKQIVRASERAASLTRQLLAFSRRHMMQPVTLDLNGLIRDLQGMVQSLLSEHIELRCEMAEKLAPVFADRWSLEQALVNLIVNARDAMPQGGRLSIRTAAVEIDAQDAALQFEAQAGPFVRLTIEDTGCGMDAQTLTRLFEPFFTTKPIGQGTGMGLAMVYAIVKQHGGWVQVFSQPGSGSTFHLFLPPSKEPTDNSHESTALLPMLGGNETILLVEDDADLAAMAADVLTSVGYRTLQASSGVEALNAWYSHDEKIDLLFTDLVMPEAIQGGQLVEKLRARKPGLRVVLTTGHNSALGVQAVAPCGTFFISKPYSASALLKIVRSCFDQTPVGNQK